MYKVIHFSPSVTKHEVVKSYVLMYFLQATTFSRNFSNVAINLYYHVQYSVSSFCIFMSLMLLQK